MEVILDAVDVSEFEKPVNLAAFRTEFHIPDSALVIAAVGQLIPRKGHRFLLEALAELKGKLPKFRLIIFGQGPLETELRELAASRGLGDFVQFAGFHKDLDALYGCFDIFVHPALAEGLGVVTLKAAAAGVPVVGFEAGGLSEAIDHNNPGILVQPEDVNGLASAIDSLMRDEPLRKKMGDAGRERMRKEFSIDTMADKHVHLYQSILNA